MQQIPSCYSVYTRHNQVSVSIALSDTMAVWHILGARCTLSSGRSSAYCCGDHKRCAASAAKLQIATNDRIFREWVNGTKFQISTSIYVFFPELYGSIFDSHHGFHVEYGTDRDDDLGFHLDDSELTSNVSLSKQFEEKFTRIGELYFRGTRCKKHDVTHTDTKPEEISDDSHTPDQAVLRLGSRATTSGHGASMIPCSVLKREEIISQGILKLVRSMLQRKESKAEPDSCCQKKGVY